MGDGRYRVTMGDLEKRDPRRRQKALEALRTGPWTPQDLAKAWGVNESTSFRLLQRLCKQGYALCEDGKPSYYGNYTITRKGLDKLQWLKGDEKREEHADRAELGELYPDLEDLSDLIEGPVSLMRVTEIDDVDEAVRAMVKRGFSKDDIAVEVKFDGWLTQIAGRRIYSRRGMDLTPNFPPIAALLAPFRDAHVIGELVYWNPDGVMEQPIVTTIANVDDPAEAVARLRKLRGHFQLVLFDVLAWDGEDVTKLPFLERRKFLGKGLGTQRGLGISKIHPFDKWKDVYGAAPEMGAEGVVLKNKRAPYFWKPLGQTEPKPQGVQWKLKHVSTDDFVVTNLSVTEKEKLLLHFGQFWKGQIVPVGEVDNLSREDEKVAIELFKKGPFVVELAFQERFPRPPGKLRNPRVVRWRPDKPLESAKLPAKFAPR